MHVRAVRSWSCGVEMEPMSGCGHGQLCVHLRGSGVTLPIMSCRILPACAVLEGMPMPPISAGAHSTEKQ